MSTNEVTPTNSTNYLIISDNEQNQVIINQPNSNIIQVTIPQNVNNITQEENITVINDPSLKQVNITDQSVKIVQLTTLGPQGAQGPQGSTGSSQPFYQSGSTNIWATTASLQISNLVDISGSLIITGSLIVSGSNTFKNIGTGIFTGSLLVSGSALYNGNELLTTAITGGYVTSASFNAFTASYKTDSASFDTRILNTSSSIAGLSSSYLVSSASFDTRISNTSASISSLSASFLTFSGSYNTGSFTGSFTGSSNLDSLTATSAVITGNVTVLGTASINTLIVNQTQLSTGSNQLGDAANDFQTLYGTVRIPTGSLTVTGSILVEQNNPINFGNQVNIQRAGTNIIYGSSAETIVNTIGTSPIRFQIGSSEVARITGSLFGIGTTSPLAILDIRGTQIASGSIARTMLISSSLSASANGDTLVGLDITPTFNLGAFTGTTSRALRVTGNIELVSCTIFGTTTFNNNVFFSSQIYAYAFRSNASIDFTFRKNDNTIFATFFNSTGNVTLQNGGTFTDAGYRLDVNGTARIQNQLTTTGSITAASAIARGVYMNQTLVAAANGDVLVGLDINPTFTVGSFTGTTLVPLRIGGSNGGAGILFSNQNWKIGSNGGNMVYNGGQAFDFYSGISATPITFSISTSRIAQFHATTGNFTLQNGGTFTDAGFRLDVNGTARIQNQLTVKGSGTTSATTALLVQNSNLSSSLAVLDNSNIGLGTTTPLATLDVRGTQTASSAIARTVLISSSLSASANSDVLIGLDINPTFNTGSFTSVLQRFASFSIAGSNKGSIGFDTAANIFQINSAGRLDFNALGNQIFFTSANTFFQSALNVNRTGTATSTATQASSYSLVFQTSLWNGSSQLFRYGSFKNIASTTVNLDSRFSYFGNGTNGDGTGATEYLSIFGLTGNTVIQNGGTFTDNGYRLDISGSARVTNNLTVTGSLNVSGSIYNNGVNIQSLAIAYAIALG